MELMNGPFAVGWQSNLTSQLRYHSSFDDALQQFNQLVYGEWNMVAVSLSDCPTLNGPLVTIATWSQREGIVRSPSHRLANRVVRPSALA